MFIVIDKMDHLEPYIVTDLESGKALFFETKKEALMEGFVDEEGFVIVEI